MTKLLGTAPNQAPTNADLGDLAYQNGDNCKIGPITIDSSGNLLVNTTTDHNGKVSIKSTGTEQHLVFEQENVSTDGWGIRSYGAGGGALQFSRMTGTTSFAPLVTFATTGLTVTGTAVATQGMPIVTNSANTKTLALTDSGSYIRFSNNTITVLTIPTNATVAFPTGAEVTGTGVANTVSIANSAGVTLNSKESLVTASAGGAFFLKKVGTNEWDLHGALE
jgi:hypothetical protein